MTSPPSVMDVVYEKISIHSSSKLQYIYIHIYIYIYIFTMFSCSSSYVVLPPLEAWTFCGTSLEHSKGGWWDPPYIYVSLARNALLCKCVHHKAMAPWAIICRGYEMGVCNVLWKCFVFAVHASLCFLLC